MGRIADAFRFAERSAGPALDLVIRLWLAGIFFTSGVIKISDWDKALFLATYEYPVSWMDPVTAAYLGVSIELAGAVLFALGLATRFAALAMLALSLVIQLNYVVLDINLFWIALFGWYVIRGPQTLSLDHALTRGLAAAAVPFAATAVRAAQWVRDRAGGVYQLVLRLGLAAALALAAAPVALDALGEFLPLRSAVGFVGPAALAAAALLALGLGARFVATGAGGARARRADGRHRGGGLSVLARDAGAHRLARSGGARARRPHRAPIAPSVSATRRQAGLLARGPAARGDRRRRFRRAHLRDRAAPHPGTGHAPAAVPLPMGHVSAG